MEEKINLLKGNKQKKNIRCKTIEINGNIEEALKQLDEADIPEEVKKSQKKKF